MMDKGSDKVCMALMLTFEMASLCPELTILSFVVGHYQVVAAVGFVS